MPAAAQHGRGAALHFLHLQNLRGALYPATNASQLIVGRIPEDQGRIPADMLSALDMKLREV